MTSLIMMFPFQSVGIDYRVIPGSALLIAKNAEICCGRACDVHSVYVYIFLPTAVIVLSACGCDLSRKEIKHGTRRRL